MLDEDDFEDAVEAVESVAGKRLQYVLAVDGYRTSVLQVDDAALDAHGGRDAFDEMTDGLRRRLALDVASAELERGADPVASDLRAFVTYTERHARVRVWNDGRGLIVAVDRDAPTDDVVTTLERAFDAC